MSEFKTTSIKFTSRASVKIRDSYYTFESTIEKSCPDNCTDEEYVDAKRQLWDEVNGEVDNQINDLMVYLQNKSR